MMGDYAARRAELVARSDLERAAVADVFVELRGRLSVAETVVAAVRRVHRHRALIGALAIVAVVAPRTARKWIRGAAWAIPLVTEGVRLTRSPRD